MALALLPQQSRSRKRGSEDMALFGGDFTAAHSGQLKPSLPSPAPFPLFSQKGPFGSLWIRITSCYETPATAPVGSEACLLTKAVETGCQESLGAVYVAMHELCEARGVIRLLKDRGFAFHHHDCTTCEMVYYKWAGPPPDKVPSYATSIEGGGALILSPDEKEVCSAATAVTW